MSIVGKKDIVDFQWKIITLSVASVSTFDLKIIKNCSIIFILKKVRIDQWLKVANVEFVIITQNKNVLKKNANVA